ncbi:hypothetical protein ES703_60171 [subsurface metagenome]
MTTLVVRDIAVGNRYIGIGNEYGTTFSARIILKQYAIGNCTRTVRVEAQRTTVISHVTGEVAISNRY